MKSKILVTGLLTAAMLSASIVPASAHDFHRGWGGHGGGRDGGFLFGLLGGAVVAVATIATLPVRVVADAVSEPGPAPVYAAPAQAYYPQPTYYAPQPRQVVYAYPQQAYAYPAAPAYYYPGY